MKTLTLAQAQQLAMLTPSDIEQVYSGRPSASGNHCRCGCRGTYRYSSTATLPQYLDQSDVNDAQVAKVLGILQARLNEVVTADDADWFDVEVNGRSYTAYVKKGVL